MKKNEIEYSDLEKVRVLLSKLLESTSKVKSLDNSILGSLGIIVFSSMYDHYFKSAKSEAILEHHMNLFSEALGNYSMKKNEIQSLSTGYLSFGIAYEFLKKYSDLEPLPDLEETLDEIAIAALQFQLNLNNLDFLYGATGIMHYILEYTSDKKKLDLAVKLYVEYLIENQIPMKGGITWEDYYFRQREGSCGINLGLAHGVVGILKVLTLIHKYYNNKEVQKKIAPLIKGVGSFLEGVAHQKEDIVFPYYYAPNQPTNREEKRNTRLAWCYGDLSNAFILEQLNENMKDESTVSLSKTLIEKTLERKQFESTLVNDGGLCHGAAGIFHLYHIMSKNLENSSMQESSNYWLSKTVEYCSQNTDEGTYKKYNPIKKVFEEDYGLLEGASGVGLSMISLLTGDRSWDYCLLLND